MELIFTNNTTQCKPRHENNCFSNWIHVYIRSHHWTTEYTAGSQVGPIPIPCKPSSDAILCMYYTDAYKNVVIKDTFVVVDPRNQHVINLFQKRKKHAIYLRQILLDYSPHYNMYMKLFSLSQCFSSGRLTANDKCSHYMTWTYYQLLRKHIYIVAVSEIFRSFQKFSIS